MQNEATAHDSLPVLTMPEAALSDHIKLHTLAAEQLERAASHNRQAVQHYLSGNIEQGRFHAYVAEGHYMDAGPLAERLSALATAMLMLSLRRKEREGRSGKLQTEEQRRDE